MSLTQQCCRPKSEPQKLDFTEASNHCRWKGVLYSFLEAIKIQDFNGLKFEDIFSNIYDKTKFIKGLGMLTTYDITAAICCYYTVEISRVYIIGKGPKRAIQILELDLKKIKIGKIKLNYVEIEDTLKSLQQKYNINLKKEIDGDSLETYLCNWQKKIKTNVTGLEPATPSSED